MIVNDSTGAPLDITSATFSGQVRSRKLRSGRLLAEMTFEITDALAGEFTVSMDDTTTSKLDRDGYYDIWVLVGILRSKSYKAECYSTLL